MVYDTNYDCCYEASGTVGKSISRLTERLNVSLGHYACYNRVYSRLKSFGFGDITYRIYIPKDNIKGMPYNLCNKVETKKILRCLQKTVEFSYKFTKGSFRKSEILRDPIDYTVLVVNIKGSSSQHVWITSMLRALYEWPYNIAAKEACELQSKVKIVNGIDLSKESWLNLYLTIVAQLGSSSLHGVVTFQKQPKAWSYQDWKQKIESLKSDERVIDQITRSRRLPIGVSMIYIDCEEDYNKGVESRASKYVAAYKDKLTWKN